MIKSSVIIVENTQGGVFIVEDKQEKSQIHKILDKNIDDENETVITLGQVREDDVIIEEYLDEFYEDVKNESLSNIYSDHKYTTIEQDDFEEDMIEEDDHKQFAVLEIYEEHIEPKSNPKKKQHKFHQLTGKSACKYCETVFRTKELLKHHAPYCPYLQCDPRNFICRICNKELSKKTFSNHLHEGVLECQYCEKKFVNPRNLKTHIDKIHKNEAYIPPKSPDRTFTSELKIREEEACLDEETGMIINPSDKAKEKKRYVKKSGRFECDLCGRIFGLARSLSTHLLLHTKEHRFQCEVCGEKFTTRTGYSKHACLNRKRKRPEKDFRTVDVRNCKYCNVWFSSLEEKISHLCEYQSPNDPKVFTCRYCLLEMSKHSFNKHMSRHIDPKEYQCQLCDKKFTNETALITHLTTHSGNRPHACNLCSKSFINKTLLQRHSRFHGVNIPKYKCDVCNKEMASKYHLKTHRLQLHGDHHICQICKETFSTREKLKDHYQNNHEPYRCHVCSKTFVLPRYLKMHEKLHKGEPTRQYKCNFCQKKFSKRALANHVYSAHPDSFDAWRDKNMQFIET